MQVAQARNFKLFKVCLIFKSRTGYNFQAGTSGLLEKLLAPALQHSAVWSIKTAFKLKTSMTDTAKSNYGFSKHKWWVSYLQIADMPYQYGCSSKYISSKCHLHIDDKPNPFN